MTAAELRQAERERRYERIRELKEQHARGSDSGNGIIRKAMGDVTVRAAEAEAPHGLVLFGDDRDQRLIDTLGMVIGIGRREGRRELDKALAERIEPQLLKIRELELKVAELSGAIDVLRGAAPPPPAKFPAVRAWTADTVYHEGDIVAFAGSTYQATKDTARTPGSRDWTCLAIAGAGLTIRGTYDSSETYKHLDVVMMNGSSFVALKDSPGPCPGSDWHLLASRGKIGKRGERGPIGMRGERGERGEAAPAIRDWEIDRTRYVATPIMTDGTRGAAIELRGLFEQFLSEVGDG